MVYTDGIHLIADSWEELHDFALKIGLKRQYFQKAKSNHPHYDLMTKKRLALAISLGAIRMQSTKMFKLMVEKGIWKLNRRKL